MTTGTDERVLPKHPDNYSDESDVHHAACNYCFPYGTLTTGDPYVGLCGADAINRPTGMADPRIPPANACPECLLIVMEGTGCPKCGHK